MAYPLHKDLTTIDLHTPGYVQATDPGAIGTHKLWIDTSGGFGAWQTNIRNGTDTGWESIGVGDHGLLLGLGDDDHAQYAMLAGRASGQTLIGGTTAGAALTLQSTSANGTLTGAAIKFLGGNNGATTLFTIRNDKRAAIGVDAATITELFEVRGTLSTASDVADDRFGIRADLTIDLPSVSTKHYSALLGRAVVPAGNSLNFTDYLSAVYPYFVGEGSGTYSNIYGVNTTVRLYNNGAYTNVSSFFDSIQINDTVAITSYKHIEIGPVVVNDVTASVGTEYGLYVGNITAPIAANRYAIYTAGVTNKIYFAGPTTLDGLLTVNARLVVTGNSDVVQAVIEGYSGQANDLINFKTTNTGNIVAGITPSGQTYWGHTAVIATAGHYFKDNLATRANGAQFSRTLVNPASSRNGTISDITAQATSAAFSNQIVSAQYQAYVGAGNTQNWNGTGVSGQFGLVGMLAHVETRSGATGTLGYAQSLVLETQLDGMTTTNWRGLSILTPTGTNALTNAYAIYISDQTKGATLNYAIYTNAGLVRFGDSIVIADAKNIILDTTTGTKFGTATNQKLGFWNAAPIVQPTTAIAAATFVANAGAAVNDASTFDGYTIGQAIKALRNAGLLA